MKIDATWLKQHAAAFMIVAALLCFFIGHDPKVPVDIAHRCELIGAVLALLMKLVCPPAVVQYEHVLAALQAAGLVPTAAATASTGSQSVQSDQTPSS